MKAYFDQHKYEIFPEIKNWRDPQNQYRHETNVRMMEYKYWFWFHPSAFKLMSFGMNVIALMMCAIGMLILIAKGAWFMIFIPALLLGVPNTIGLINKIQMKAWNSEMNFYDLWMREP